jgi:deoxycytidylate deaminase/dephospho-CoA kinase
MPPTMPSNLLTIGLTGSFGSGCGYTAENVLARQGFRVKSLSSVLKREYRAETGKSPDDATRKELQDFGDQLRTTKGEEYLAKVVWEEIAEECKKDSGTFWVIDSIRNPQEVYHLRNRCHEFFLFGLYADKETRWKRVKEKYKGDEREFEEDDARDTGRDSLKSGQRVADCFAEADVVIPNNTPIDSTKGNDFKAFDGRVGTYIDLLKKPLAHQKPIRQQEAIMAAAYAVSQQSSCLKRKVGAVIVDASGNIIASGFNEVPSYGRPCEGQHGRCFRDLAWDKFFPELKQLLPEAEAKQDAVRHLFRRKFKILDYCQSLHAEENAIVNLARNGRSVPMEECKLYTTTYPCRLCANKIVNLGIKHIIYLEPYPDEAAKIILGHAAVKDEFFEGVTFRAYFRLYGDTQ